MWLKDSYLMFLLIFDRNRVEVIVRKFVVICSWVLGNKRFSVLMIRKRMNMVCRN